MSRAAGVVTCSKSFVCTHSTMLACKEMSSHLFQKEANIFKRKTDIEPKHAMKESRGAGEEKNRREELGKTNKIKASLPYPITITFLLYEQMPEAVVAEV